MVMGPLRLCSWAPDRQGGATRAVIVAVTAANSIYALDASNGAQVWRRNFGPPDGTGVVPGGFGIEASPVIDRTSGRVHAYNAATGADLWNSGSAITCGATFAAPMVASGTLYVGSWDGYTTAAGGTVRAFAAGSAPPPPPPPNVLLGSQVVQSTVDNNALGSAEAFQTTAGASGTVGVLSIYVECLINRNNVGRGPIRRLRGSSEYADFPRHQLSINTRSLEQH